MRWNCGKCGFDGEGESSDKVQNLVTGVIGKALREASPKGAAHVNEISIPQIRVLELKS